MSKVDLIMRQLSRVAGPKRRGGTDVFIVCPFHQDSQPSCVVCVTPGTGVPLGYFNCFGCPEKGPWNKLADALGLERMDEDGAGESETYLDRESLEKRRSRVGLSEVSVAMPEGVPYPYRKWRGIPGKVVRAAGGVMAADRWGDVYLYLPVEQDVDGRSRELVGVIRARLRKRKGAPSYKLESGSQVKEGGLFPLAAVQRMLKRTDSNVLALVEGQRDALRLIANGIPALSIISTTAWSPEKAQSAAWLCLRHGVRPLVMMDGDGPGEKCQRQALRDLREWSFDGKGPSKVDLRKFGEDLDPGNIPQALLDKIKRKALSPR